MMHRVSHLDVVRRETNFMVRYKWALESFNNNSGHPDPFRPDFEEFLMDEKAVQRNPVVSPIIHNYQRLYITYFIWAVGFET